MSSRFPPSSGYNSRDRSPQRFGDRRPPAGPRGPDDASPAPFGRDPPRGPRALVDSPRGGPFGGGGPRGRGYGRGEFRDRDRDPRDRDRDRDFRDTRDGPLPFRREMDRDWGRRDREFDPRENRMSFGRGRSRSPTRDFRDMRDPPGRDVDLVRMRRNSRDSLLSASSGGPDGPPSSGGHPRGGSIRGRGRGDWDGGRGRGRPPYLDDRETFRRRSRSRDGWRDRGRDRPVDRDRDLIRDRERDRDLDRRFDRRDDWDGRRPDRDDRPNDPWKRPPSRAGSRAPSGSTPASLPHAPPVGLPDRIPDQTLADQDRKASLPPASDPRRDAERAESVKDLSPVVKHSPPPAAPQVPAFGSVTAPIPSSSGGNEYADKDENELPPQPPAQPPTGPKTGRGEQDPLSRVIKASTNLSELSPPTAPAAMTKRDSIPGEPLPPGRSSSVTSSPTFARLPHPRAGSREPSASPKMQPSNIPTGPRALQQRQGSLQRGIPKGSKQWVRPGYPRAPSLANAPSKRESIDEHGPSSVGEDFQHGSRELERDELSPNRSRRSPPQIPTVEKEEPETENFEDSAPVHDFDESEEEEDDENIVFTQDYLEERKQIFEKDMRRLRAEMPPPPLEDQTIVALLMNIQLLGMVALEPVPERPTEPVPSVEKDEQPTKASAADRVVSFAPAVKGREPIPIGKTVIPPVVSHEEITIDSLPFLHSGPPTPISDMEVYQENTTARDRLKDTFRNELSKRQKEIAKKNATLREEYMSYYKPWRLAVWDRDRHKDQNKSVTPGPVSPPAPILPPTPAPIPEGREGRRYKGNSELDFLNALKASEISAQEELERRRTKMATARPDLSREAVIPDMMEPHEEKAGVYKDMNNIIEPENAMAVFGFVPRPNDFSPEEHTIFTDAFMAHPKRWGKIAESLPGRDFQQCIVHYYLTKEEIKYKAKLNKRWSRRGRGKAKSSRPKSNALIADLGVVKPDFEGEEEPQVTDTGRPRRAAAPTFGGDANEVGDGTAARRGQAGKDGEAAEKPAGRRGARAGGPRTQRRGRAAQQEQKAQAMQGIPMGAKMEMGGDGMLESLPLDAADKEASTPMPRGRAPRGRTKEGMYVFESTEADMPAKQPETGYGSLQPTSYWSVPEQRDFPQLLEHFGRDFEGISNFMKTKTTVMVKNYYQRRLDSGKKDFEESLIKAEENKARGEPTGPLPVPSVAPKRRYEATPSSIVPRPLAPHGEMEADEARFSVKGKPGTLSPQPMPMPGRPLLEKDRNRYPPLAQAVAASTMPPSLALGDRGGLSHRMAGPRLGYFTDDRRDSSILSAPRMDPLAHGQSSLLPPQASMGPSQQAYVSAQQPSSLIPPAHSRQPSLTQRPGSPSQLQRQDLDLSSVHRDSFAQRPYYGLGQPGGLAPSPRPVLSPVKDAPRSSVTPAPESSRQVPAKRSNIMSILNDEPEEPQPRKRFASEHIASTPPSRSIYQPTAPLQQYPQSSRGYSDYPGYGATSAGSGPSANNDWMARFDPRAQQGSQPPPPQQQSGRPATSLASQSFSPYAPAPSQPSVSLSNLPVPSPAPTPPPQTGSQRSSYPNVFSQPPSSQAPPPSGSREGIYRPGSPPTRYGSSSNLLGMPPRPSDAQSTYASAASPTPAAGQPHSQSYQQHVQGLVSGSQSHRSNLPGGSPQYGHSTPPPPSHGSRSNGPGSMPSLASFGRSYTPPPAFHPSVGGGYPPPSSGPGSIPPLHQRPPAPGENASTPTHQRAYSPGNNLPPPSQPPR